MSNTFLPPAYQQLPLIVGAGLATVLLSLGGNVTGFGGSALLALFANIPLLVLVITRGWQAGLLGGIVAWGAQLMAFALVALEPVHVVSDVSLLFLGRMVLPTVLLGVLLDYNQREATLRNITLTRHPATGAVLVAALCALVTTIGMAVTHYQQEEIVAVLQKALAQVAAKSGESSFVMPPESTVQSLAQLVPAIFGVTWFFSYLVNIVLAVRITEKIMPSFGQKPFSAVHLPAFLAVLFTGLLLVATTTGGEVGYFAKNLALLLSAPFLVAGFSVAHSLTTRLKEQRTVALAVFYGVALVLPMGLGIVVFLGVFDALMNIRKFERLKS
jgi:hypothetical protein